MTLGTYGRVTPREHLLQTVTALEVLVIRTNRSVVFSDKVKREIVEPLLVKIRELRHRAILAGVDARQGRLM